MAFSKAPNIFWHGSKFFNSVGSGSHLLNRPNGLCNLVQRKFSSEISVTKPESKQNLEMEAKDRHTRDELVQKLPELIFSVTSNKIVSDAIVCWHPDVPFPYEMSKPLPLDVKASESNLKIQSLVPVREVFRQKHHKTVVKELMQLTYTSKHRWFGRFGMEKRRHVKLNNPLNQKRDREYL